MPVLTTPDPAAEIACTLPVLEMGGRLVSLQELIGGSLLEAARTDQALRIVIDRERAFLPLRRHRRVGDRREGVLRVPRVRRRGSGRPRHPRDWSTGRCRGDARRHRGARSCRRAATGDRVTDGLRIGDVARSAGVNVQTLRYYERRGLVLPEYRRHSGQREYDEISGPSRARDQGGAATGLHARRDPGALRSLGAPPGHGRAAIASDREDRGDRRSDRATAARCAPAWRT